MVDPALLSFTFSLCIFQWGFGRHQNCTRFGRICKLYVLAFGRRFLFAFEVFSVFDMFCL